MGYVSAANHRVFSNSGLRFTVLLQFQRSHHRLCQLERRKPLRPPTTTARRASLSTNTSYDMLRNRQGSHIVTLAQIGPVPTAFRGQTGTAQHTRVINPRGGSTVFVLDGKVSVAPATHWRAIRDSGGNPNYEPWGHRD